MADKKNILVVGQMDERIVGDYLSNPFLYFGMQLSRVQGMNLHVERSNLGLRRATQARDLADTIIVVGAEALNHPDLAADIDFWTNKPVPLVLWGAGAHDTNLLSVKKARPEPEAYHQVKSFALIGLRDAAAGFPWVPCPSCMHSLLKPQPGNGTSTAFVFQPELRAFPEKLAAVISQEPNPLVTFSDRPFAELIGVLRQVKTVVTNSHDAAYWATLLGKRVIAINGGTKMRGLKHAPAVVETLAWRSALDRACDYPDALEECREANIDFATRVATLVARLNRHVPFVRDPVTERASEISLPQTPALKHNIVPRILHFVFGLSPDFGGKPFNLMHQVAIRSAIERIKPEETFFHYRHAPITPLFDSVKNLMTLVRLPTVDAGIPKHFAHQADIIRLEALYERGGIYLDLDTITVDDFDPLLVHPFTMGVQGRTMVDGLCNAVMLAAPQNSNIKNWLDAYARFSDVWDLFSVRLPYVMWRSGRWDVHVEPYDSFHWPSWRPEGLQAMFERDVSFPNARCHHLWETISYPRYFGGGYEQNALMIQTGRSTYSRLARPYLGQSQTIPD